MRRRAALMPLDDRAAGRVETAPGALGDQIGRVGGLDQRRAGVSAAAARLAVIDGDLVAAGLQPNLASRARRGLGVASSRAGARLGHGAGGLQLEHQRNVARQVQRAGRVAGASAGRPVPSETVSRRSICRGSESLAAHVAPGGVGQFRHHRAAPAVDGGARLVAVADVEGADTER